MPRLICMLFIDFIPDTSVWNDETCTLDMGLVEETEDGYKAKIEVLIWSKYLGICFYL